VSDSLDRIAESSYRWGDCQAILFDPARTDVFPGLYLSSLWHKCRNSGRAKLGILEPTFCGMKDLSHDAIVSYLHTKKLTILGEWQMVDVGAGEAMRQEFVPLGFCFLATACEGKSSNSAFGAYAFFRSAWRTPQQTVLSALGIAYLFREYRLSSLHGIRYADNKLTARWMAGFGFRDLAEIPDSIVRYGTGELEPSVVSTLSRKDFEIRLGRVTSLDQG
jgi:hypothetical protein